MSQGGGMEVLTLVIEPSTPGDRQRLADGIQQLTAEDPRFRARPGPLPGEVSLGATSEEHLEVIVDRLKREFNVQAWVGRPKVAYREAVTRPADGEMKYARQTAGGGQYAHVKVRLYPRELGAGYVFENGVTGGAVPAAFVMAVDQGFQDGLSHGVLAGYPIDDARVQLYDGSYHDVDSSEAAFRTAASMAVQEAARNAGPVLLEPVMRVEAVVPAGSVSDVVANLVFRRGRIQSRHDGGEMHTVRALVPLIETFGYPTDLRSRTRGRGTCVIQFEAYVPVQISEDDSRDSPVGVPRKPSPKPRDSGIALPEPDDNGAGE